MRRLRSASIGSISAWLPSRRSTQHQIGALSMTRDGHWRSGRSMGGNGAVFVDRHGGHRKLLVGDRRKVPERAATAMVLAEPVHFAWLGVEGVRAGRLNRAGRC